MEGFVAIRDVAPIWLRNAIELSPLTLLRREDVVTLKFSDVHDGALWIMPGKTENSTGVRLKIALTEELDATIKRCRDDVASPYLIHRLPEKARPRDMRAKAHDHHTQVLPEQLSRTFAEVRSAIEAFKGKANAPTSHEIRSWAAPL